MCYSVPFRTWWAGTHNTILCKFRWNWCYFSGAWRQRIWEMLTVDKVSSEPVVLGLNSKSMTWSLYFTEIILARVWFRISQMTANDFFCSSLKGKLFFPCKKISQYHCDFKHTALNFNCHHNMLWQMSNFGRSVNQHDSHTQSVANLNGYAIQSM